MTAHRPLARHGLALVALLIASSAAYAEETVIALSPEAKAKILDDASTRSRPAFGEPAVNGLGSQIHGEMSMMVGTNGARGVAGSAVAPLGDSAVIGFAFENTRYGGRR